MDGLSDDDVRSTLTCLYRAILGREPDASGLEAYYARIRDGGWSDLEGVMRDFVMSPEFRSLRGETAELSEVPKAEYMDWKDIGEASEAWRAAEGAPGSAYDKFRGRYLLLPDWFKPDVDPFSAEYRDQQDRLWRLMIGEDKSYAAKTAELTMDDFSGPLARQGLYSASSEMAGHHLIALGHLIKHSNIKPSDRVLEYGAGRGDIAVALARIGAEVHTIDVDPNFCDLVKRQGRLFDVFLTPHLAEFGENPAGGKYRLIYFYEAFHHARDFLKLIPLLKEYLEPGGKILMAGEPINPEADRVWSYSCPYPWGIRLEAEVAAIVRFRKWYELGFRQEFLAEAFARNGFAHRVHHADLSRYAIVHEFWLHDFSNFPCTAS